MTKNQVKKHKTKQINKQEKNKVNMHLKMLAKIIAYVYNKKEKFHTQFNINFKMKE